MLTSKLLNYSLYTLVLSIPFQIGYHFWPQFSFVAGNKIDYLSPTVHWLDLVSVVVIFLYFISGKPKVLLQAGVFKISLFLILISFASTLVATAAPAAFLASLRLIEVVLVGFILAERLKHLAIKKLLVFMNIGVIAASLLALGQFVWQQSLGFWILGERSFSSSTFGIARADIFGQLWMRSYASFPHPNLLGAYLVLTLLINLALVIKLSDLSRNKSLKYVLILSSVMGIQLLALIVTFSRSAIAALILGLLVASFYLLKKRAKILYILIPASSLLVALLAFLVLNLFGGDSDSIYLRSLLNEFGLSIILAQPFGIGANNFIPYLADHFQALLPSYLPLNTYLQPIHNLALLVFVELGFAGLLVLLIVIFVSFRSALQARSWLGLSLLCALSLLSLTDHYFWTLTQGQLLFWLIVAIVNSRSKFL